MSNHTAKPVKVTPLGLPEKEYPERDLTEKIIGCAIKVHRALGPGYLEAIYENALAFELRDLGLRVKQQEPVQVFYKGQLVGDYFADLIVDDKVIVELKAAHRMDKAFETQLLNYLKARGIEVGLLLNFARKVEIKRMVFSSF